MIRNVKSWLKKSIIGTIGAATASLTLLAAEAAADAIIYDYVDTTYRFGSVSRATDGGALVEIYGAPNEDVEAVVRSLRLPGWFSPRPFVAVAADPTDYGRDRFVLVFGSGVDARRACNAPNTFLTPSVDSPRTVLGVFCAGGRADTYAQLRSDSLGQPGTAGFERAMDLLLRVMLPRRNLNIGDPDRCRAGC